MYKANRSLLVNAGVYVLKGRNKVDGGRQANINLKDLLVNIIASGFIKLFTISKFLIVFLLLSKQ